MSELKEHLFCECDECIREYRGPLSNEMRPYYLKSEADKVIKELKEKCRWRKCSEEMPEDGAEVLASDGVGIWLCYKTTMCDGSPWFQPDGLPHIEGVTHWMPLPKTPKEVLK